MSIYDYSYTSIEGKEVKMSEYRGKAILIVNTASKCGFTPQYKGLEALYQKYKEKGFTVIGFPCNQFMGQEPGGEEKISEFCSIRYGVTFPLSSKVDVRGDTAIDLYKYLIEKQGFKGDKSKGFKAKLMRFTLKLKYRKNANDNQVKWNFTKFLVSKDGQVVARYEPTVEPEDIASDIEKLL